METLLGLQKVGFKTLADDCFIPHIFFIGITRKTRIIDVVYNASNNELVRTKTLVKNCIVLIDATPLRLWFENHYALPLGKRKNTKLVGFIALIVLTKLTMSYSIRHPRRKRYLTRKGQNIQN